MSNCRPNPGFAASGLIRRLLLELAQAETVPDTPLFSLTWLFKMGFAGAGVHNRI